MQAEQTEKSHRHLFTPKEWCLVPYMEQFGLKADDVHNASGPVRGYLFDQYVRACGFEPTEAYVFIVKPNGYCELKELQPGAPAPCCEDKATFQAMTGPSTAPIPPWADNAPTKGMTGA